MRIAILTTDNREQFGHYDRDEPFFGPAPSALLAGFARIPDEAEIHVVSCSKRRMTTPERLASNIRFHQVIVPHLGWGRTAFAGCALAVRRLLKVIRPDLVHGQGTERDCSISAVHSGLPNVLTIHGNMQQIHRMKLLGAPLYYWLAANLETHALGRTDGVICNSLHTESLVKERTRQTWLVPNPLRPSFFEIGRPPQSKNAIPIFLTIGVISNLKRPIKILDLARRLHEKGHKVRFLFVGMCNLEDPYCGTFSNELEQGIANGYAEYLGELGETKLIEAMDQADACVHFPSEEAFGLVVAECLARGLKMFASNVGGIRDIVTGVDGAELFDDFEGLEHGIVRWLETGHPLPQSAAKLMRDRYHPTAVAREHLRIYQEVLSKRSL